MDECEVILTPTRDQSTHILHHSRSLFFPSSRSEQHTNFKLEIVPVKICFSSFTCEKTVPTRGLSMTARYRSDPTRPHPSPECGAVRNVEPRKRGGRGAPVEILMECGGHFSWCLMMKARCDLVDEKSFKLCFWVYLSGVSDGALSCLYYPNDGCLHQVATHCQHC